MNARDPREHALDLVAEVAATPPSALPARLTKLAKPMLVRLVAALLREHAGERDRLQDEIAKRDFHIARLESLLERRRT